MLIWSPQYFSGVPLVDAQHRVLFENINRLEELLHVQPIPVGELERLLHFLESYANTHFNFEEQCMHRHSCPEHDENKREHCHFRDAMAAFDAEIRQTGLNEELLVRLHAMLSNWTHGHILKIDVKLRAAVTSVKDSGASM